MPTPIALLAEDATVRVVDHYNSQVIWAVVRDGEGHGTQVCVDCRSGSPTYNHLFVAARHPNMPSAVLVERGSPEEKTVVSILQRWLDTGTYADPAALAGMKSLIVRTPSIA